MKPWNRSEASIITPIIASGFLIASCSAPPSDDSPVLNPSIEYIAHASFRITSPTGSQVVIDPYGSQIWLGYDYPDSVDTDAILISHPHYDHDAGVSRGLEFPWDTTQIPVYREPGVYEVGDITVTGIRGKHADPYGMEFGQINTIWLIETAGLRIAHWGDNGPITEEIAEALGDFHVLMIPIDAEYHILSADDLSGIAAMTSPARVIPMHYALPQLEPGDGPSDLGPIEPWGEIQEAIDWHDSSTISFNAEELAGSTKRFVVLKPAACQMLGVTC
jgi:L-ascorbate metabolism protein UlaG (beta-lactamase superfamily)